jgi:hypothetical protein
LQGGAIAGLTLLCKSQDHWIIFGEPLNGQHFMSIGFHRQHHTREHCLAIQQDGTAAACPFITADFQSVVPQPFAQERGERGHRFKVTPNDEFTPASVDADLDHLKEFTFRGNCQTNLLLMLIGASRP